MCQMVSRGSNSPIRQPSIGVKRKRKAATPECNEGGLNASTIGVSLKAYRLAGH